MVRGRIVVGGNYCGKGSREGSEHSRLASLARCQQTDLVSFVLCSCTPCTHVYFALPNKISLHILPGPYPSQAYSLIQF